MGDRVTVSISSQEHEAPINIYAHWAGEDIYPIVQDVLENSQRVGDASYLSAQIIYQVFTQLGYDGRNSFGVWSGEFTESGDDNDPMFVDADTGKWRIGNGEMDWQDKDTRIDEVSTICSECGGSGVINETDLNGTATADECPNCKED
jgi:hypothetical protein